MSFLLDLLTQQKKKKDYLFVGEEGKITRI
jgi:hypothetical protein